MSKRAGRRLARASGTRAPSAGLKDELHEQDPQLLPVWHALRAARAEHRTVLHGLVDKSLVDHDEAARFLTNHPGPRPAPDRHCQESVSDSGIRIPVAGSGDADDRASGGITLVGVAVNNLDGGEAVQLMLPFDQQSRYELDTARDRFGSSAVTRAALLGRDHGFTVALLPD
jgi:hypothetical protein